VGICNYNDNRLVNLAFFIQRSCAFLFSKKHIFSLGTNFLWLEDRCEYLQKYKW